MRVRPTLLFFLAVSSALAELIPSSRLVDWTPGTYTGVIGGIPARTTIADDGDADGITDSLEGIDNTGATNVRTAIQAAIDEASTGEVVRLPSGTFRVDSSLTLGTGFSGKTLRGAGIGSTIIAGNCTQPIIIGSASGYSYPPSPYILVTAGLTKGSTSITVSGDHASYISTGSYIQLIVENDPSIPVVSVYNYDVHTNQSPTKMLCKVASKSGGNLTIFPPLPEAYGGGSLEVRVAPQVFSVTGIGLENLTVDCTAYTGGSGGSFSGVYMVQAHSSWIRNVKSIEAWNYAIILADCLNSEVRNCWIGELKGSGSNGAGLLFANWFCLVEDNVIVDAFPNIEVNNGSAGNAFLYNYGNGMADTNHAPQNHYNLHEGNAWSYMMSDGYFGGENDLTIHRNYLWGSGVGNIHMRRFSRRFSVVGNLMAAYSDLSSDGFPNIGNVDSTGTAQLSLGDPWRDYQMTGELTTRTSDSVGVITLDSGKLYGGSVQVIRLVWGANLDQQRFATPSSVTGSDVTIADYSGGTALPTVGTTIHIGPGAYYGGPSDNGSYQELDLDVAATAIDKGNHFLDGATTSSLGGDTDPESLCNDSKALSEARGVVWGGLSWPPFNGASPSTANVARIPAGYRYVNGTDPPAGSAVPTTGAKKRIRTGGAAGGIAP